MDDIVNKMQALSGIFSNASCKSEKESVKADVSLHEGDENVDIDALELSEDDICLSDLEDLI
jgi:hypothetical protein